MSVDRQKSAFHQYRSTYKPRVPRILREESLASVESQANVLPQIAAMFPETIKNGVKALNFKVKNEEEGIRLALRVGCVLSGGQASGGHNVIVGLYDYLKRTHKNSQLFGFLNGPKGIFTGDYREIDADTIDYFRNRGGFDMICSGRDKIETPQQLSKSLKYCESLKLDGLVVIGGDDSNTNAAILAQFFLQQHSNIKVVGCPKTIDGDLKNDFVEVSFGFDTACKTYAECIGSIMTDTLSSKKYYHFIRLMGRSASHIALECALLTRPTYAFIGEEVQKHRLTVQQLVSQLVDIIVQRAQRNKNYGVVLIPEGLIEFIPQMNTLISEINKLMIDAKAASFDELKGIILSQLTGESREIFEFLPKQIAEQLLLDRDPHGNVQVAKIETQKFIIDLITQELKKRDDFKGKFSPLANYFGYEGRCAFPTIFDCDYCYSLGQTAGAIIEVGWTGLMSCVRLLEKQVEDWLPGGYPLVTMMNIETRKNKAVPVIKKALVDLKGTLFTTFLSLRDTWSLEDSFNLVGSVQYEFPELKPFLAVPPSPTYFQTPNTKCIVGPFAFASNLNHLLIQLKTQKGEYPTVLDANVNLVFSEKIVYKNSEVGLAVQKEYPFLATTNNHIVSFKRTETKEKPKVRIGVSFNGRQSPGGHNIVAGLMSPHTEVYGFIGGNKGIFSRNYILITEQIIGDYVNQSGFHLLGRSSDKIRDPNQLEETKKTCQELRLDGLVLVGASHTITDCIIIAEYFRRSNCKTVVNAVPCAIDNNVSCKDLQISVGFASSSHTYSTLISNLMIDASSNTKYWYFIRLMGRDPSHLTLECSLSTHPNYTIISEEIVNKGWDLYDIVEDIVRVVCKRQQTNRNFGCILIPQGLPTFLPTLVRLKKEIDEIRSNDEQLVKQRMSAWAREQLQKLPEFMRKELFCRDDDGEYAVSQIETEKLLAYLVGERLEELRKKKEFKGSFSSVCHFFGYQGRCAIPTWFDRCLALTYGKVARLLTQNALSGFCTSARGLSGQPNTWFPLAIPIPHMLSIKLKSKFGVNKPIVESANVSLKSPAFKEFVQNREKWELIDHYSNPGPIQHFGPMSHYLPLTILLAQSFDFKLIDSLHLLLADLKEKIKFGADKRKLLFIKKHLTTLQETITLFENTDE